MLDYKDILTKRSVLRLSLREIAEQTGAGKSGVHDFLKAFEKCDELDFPLPPGITNAGIAMKVYGKVPGEGGRDESYEYPDYPQVLKLMNERKNMTLQVCWTRYVKRCKAEEKKPYQYRQFCELFGKWCEENYETAHFTAVIAQTMEVDFAGKTFDLINRLTGEVTPIIETLVSANCMYVEISVIALDKKFCLISVFLLLLSFELCAILILLLFSSFYVSRTD